MNQLSQILLLATGGICFALMIVFLARRGRLSMRYTLGWLFVAGSVMLGGLFAGLIDPVASWLGVSSSTVIIGLVTVTLLAITVQLSITVSGLTEQVRTLAEGQAILEERIRHVGLRRDDPPST